MVLRANGLLIRFSPRPADRYCTGGNYCVPHCPAEVAIPRICQAMDYYRVYGLKDHGQRHDDAIGNGRVEGHKAAAIAGFTRLP